jgi:GrpB-like predicted nucleotidyltransferase (UPF0157 family)
MKRRAAIKQELAARFRNDREKYTEAKTAFIRATTDKALSEDRALAKTTQRSGMKKA